MENCACGAVNRVMEGWYDWQNSHPQNPLDIIQRATLNSQDGTFGSMPYPSGSWGTSPLTFGLGNPECKALQIDNVLAIEEAAQWNFRHQTCNTAPTLPPPLQKVIFLRAGIQWKMIISINFGGSPVSTVQLVLRDNYGTRGDNQGTYPSILFPSSVSGPLPLEVTLRTTGQITMGILGVVGTTNSMFEMEWIIVP